MKMKNKLLLLYICYGWGIIADAVMTYLMLFPDRFLRFMSLNLSLDVGLQYGLRFGAPLMAGWTVLLVWAAWQPVARKAILLITVCPVIVGYLLLSVYAISAGLTTLEKSLPTLVSQIGLLSLAIFCYVNVSDGQKILKVGR